MNIPVAFSSVGLISLLAESASLVGGALANSGTISGVGRISNPVLNAGAIRATAQGRLSLAGAGTTNMGTGVIEVLDGATLTVVQGMGDNQGGIVLHKATYDNGGQPFVNSGYITGSGTLRTTSLQNTASGYVGIANGDMDVIGSVQNDGTVNVQPDCQVNFFGPVNGSGSFVGTGTVAFLAGYSPSSGPLAASFGGDLLLAGSRALTIELGGKEPGTQFDQLAVNGLVTVRGTLDLKLVNGFVPLPGDRMTVLTCGSLQGRFTSVSGMNPSGGIELHPAYSPTSLVILTSRAGENVWLLDADGSSSDGTNWAAGSPPGKADDMVAFTSVITENRTVQVDGDLTMGSLTFESEKSYLLQGPGKIALSASQDSASISAKGRHSIYTNVELGSDAKISVVNSFEDSLLTIAGGISERPAGAGAELVKVGDGTLVLSTANSFTGGTVVEAGTLQVTNAGALPAGNSLTIGAGGTVVLGSGLSVSAVSSSPIPEPSTLALLGIGAIGLLGWGWRRRKHCTVPAGMVS